MDLNTLTALSPLDGRYHSTTQPLQLLFSEYGLMKLRVKVEVYWLQYLSELDEIKEIPKLSNKANTILDNIIQYFNEKDAAQIKNLEKTTNHDVKAIEYFLKEKFAANEELNAIAEFIHFACTSEDINNLAYSCAIKEARETILLPAMQTVLTQLRQYAHQYASHTMLARTHGQAATPTTVGKEFANFVYRLERQIQQLKNIEIMGKLNGAVGNFNAHRVAYPNLDWLTLSAEFIKKLDLTINPYTTQIESHDFIAEFSDCLARLNTILIGFTRDVWGYISIGYFKQRHQEKETGSSTMPHKINPIDFENAEGNLGLANAMLHHFSEKLPISRWQRDLSDSTVLRNLGAALGYCLLAYHSLEKGLNKIDIDKAIIEHDLNQHWEVLAEPIQTVMRRYGCEKPYEQLKQLTRGQTIDCTLLHQFIQTLSIPEAAKTELLKLAPVQYIGYALELAQKV